MQSICRNAPGSGDGISDCQPGRRGLLFSLQNQRTKPCSAHNWWCVFMAPVVLGAILILELSLEMSACPALECCVWLMPLESLAPGWLQSELQLFSEGLGALKVVKPQVVFLVPKVLRVTFGFGQIFKKEVTPWLITGSGRASEQPPGAWPASFSLCLTSRAPLYRGLLFPQSLVLKSQPIFVRGISTSSLMSAWSSAPPPRKPSTRSVQIPASQE